MNKYVKFSLIVLGALMIAAPTISVVAWAFFDVRMWVVAESPSAREFAILMIHVISAILGTLIVCEAVDL